MRKVFEDRPVGAPSSVEHGQESPREPEGCARVRAPWSPPRLEWFGDVRQVTMGGTTGINESGDPMRFP